jgi:hypothetical protein
MGIFDRVKEKREVNKFRRETEDKIRSGGYVRDDRGYWRPRRESDSLAYKAREGISSRAHSAWDSRKETMSTASKWGISKFPKQSKKGRYPKFKSPVSRVEGFDMSSHGVFDDSWMRDKKKFDR